MGLGGFNLAFFLLLTLGFSGLYSSFYSDKISEGP
jgi:hypothetical protein